MIRGVPVTKILRDVQREAATEAFINKGLQVAEKGSVGSEAKPKNVLLTIPRSEHSRIEILLKTRRVRIPRHTWILEAIVEKLEREEAQ